MSGAMNRHCIPGLTMSTSPTGELLCGRSGTIKTMHTVVSVHVLYWRQRPGADTEELDVMI